MNIYWKVGSYFLFAAAALGLIHWYGSSKFDDGYAVRDAIAVKAELAATENALKVTNGWQAALDEANKRGDEREKKLKTDADNARIAADRLRDDIKGLRARIPALTREAVNRYADTASIVFSECTSKYTELAETADRIDSDRQKLDDAWPTSNTKN